MEPRQLDRDRAILKARVVDDVDRGRVAQERENVPQACLLEADVDGRPRRGVQQRRRAREARLFPKQRDGRLWARGLDTLANDSRAGRRGRPPAGCPGRTRGPAIFLQRGVELVLGFQLPSRVEVRARGIEHRPLEGDAVFGLVGVGLRGLAVVGDRGVPIADPGAVFASRKALPAAQPVSSARVNTSAETLSVVSSGVYCPVCLMV